MRQTHVGVSWGRRRTRVNVPVPGRDDGAVRPRLIAPALVAVVLAACSGDDASFETRSGQGRRVTTTTTTAAETTTTAAPTSSAAAAGTTRPAPAQPATPTCPAVPARTEPRPDRTRYVLRIDVRLAENAVVGEVTARFTPDLATDRLVFRLWPNGPRPASGGAHIDTGQATVGGHPAESTLDNPTTLVVRTGGQFPAGRAVDVTVPWRLTLPGPLNDRISRNGDAVRLGSFFPILAWEPGVGWATEPPTSGFAEASMLPSADFAVSVAVPEGVDVLATGVPDGQGRWMSTAVPEFAMSVGRFTVQTATVDAPAPVTVSVGVQAGIAESPESYLGKVVRSLRDFAARFGPYPWPTYTLAITPGLGGGIEHPMHVMQGPGTQGRTTSHEVAHMWFYGLVTSNAGRDPWLDEGLASYGEARFEHAEASFRSRTIPPEGRSRAGEPMTYWESRQSAYYRSVYVQGAQAVMAMGPLDRVDCALRHYVARSAHRVARNADFIAAASVVFSDAAATLARYGIRP
jgi:hypothetical protein